MLDPGDKPFGEVELSKINILRFRVRTHIQFAAEQLDGAAGNMPPEIAFGV